MSLVKLVIAGAVGYGIYQYLHAQGHLQHAAFAPGETDGENFAKVRHAGPEGMRSNLTSWDKADEASDESFPASDPPANY